ncbi:MAG: hypothetical protein ABEJ31_05720 [Haloarculaceae archaeon]
MSDEDISIDEKRVYGEKAGRTDLAVATGLGLAVVSVSDDLIGEFSLARRCTAVDVAAGTDALAVATDEDVRLFDGESFTATEFGPAVAVGVSDGAVLAADPDGRVRRLDAVDDPAAAEWTALGTVGAVRAIDGGLVGAADGVYRVDGDDLSFAGLDDVRDVSAAGTPLAATGDGLYYLGPGWAQAVAGEFAVVASDGERAHAATADALYERVDGEWRERSVPVEEAIAALTHGQGTYAVTDDGTVLVDVGDGWRDRALGLRDVAGVAIVP